MTAERYLFEWPNQTSAQFVVVSDGSLAVLRGIAVLISSAKRYLPLYFFKRLTVLCPTPKAQKALSEKFEHYTKEIRCLPCEFIDKDRYAAKFMLMEFALDLEASDTLVYLDYDHIFWGIPNIKAPLGQVIYVSSQKYSSSEHINKFGEAILLPERLQYNNSLIIASRNDFLAIAEEWFEKYRMLESQVSLRWREEVAFNISASRVGIRLSPVNVADQGGWHTMETATRLFHYGGNTSPALTVKSYLHSPRKNSFRQTCLESARIREVLKEMKKGIDYFKL